MPKDFYRELTAILRDHGCWLVDGGKGSHERWCSPINNYTFTVPRSKSRHTANAALKQAGIDKRI